ncbi:hypothetical protein ACIBH1_45490 [Nonomuraea sp. NPDC050663]|uniref:hypothetical protein n=1 Tax=Nonomuraea sp. NPDC050663 TaxID=3364370 RepID=UPI0037A12BE5
MSTQQFRVGDHVRAVIIGTIASHDDIERPGHLCIRNGTGDYRSPERAGRFSCVLLDDPHVTVELLAPAEWPPRPGDTWEHDGEPWFAVDRPLYDHPCTRMINHRGMEWPGELDDLLQSKPGDWTLIHRAASLTEDGE